MLLQNPEDGLYASIDECGRGALAASVVAACVVWQPGEMDHLIKDSKKLSPRMRAYLSDYIKDNAIDYSISFIDHQRIDTVNILNATMEGMHQCLDKLTVDYDHIFVDGNTFKPYVANKTIVETVSVKVQKPYTCVIKGDDKYVSIAAASILAKVARDDHMGELALHFPGYGWETNKGYGTKEHVDAISTIGVSPFHRLTFAPIARNPLSPHTQ